jgi:3-hydroxybutyryl-CoA dehydrogenase
MQIDGATLDRIGIVGIVGSGVMGAGIAEAILAAGKAVVLTDRDPVALERAHRRIVESFDRKFKKGTLDEREVKYALRRLTLSIEITSLSAVDLAIEATSETKKVKENVLASLCEIVGYRCIIATNTSSLSVSDLSASVDDQSRFIGIHFFNPAPVMPLVEVVATADTSDLTRSKVTGFLHDIGKISVEAADSPGFIVNRLLIPMINEAFHVLGEGVATAEHIDLAMRAGSNHPIGPLALADLIGLDVCSAIVDSLQESLPAGSLKKAPRLQELVESGRLGKKAGRGVYEY